MDPIPAEERRAPTDRMVGVIAAIHHPVRRRLLELLNLDGPGTVSRLADASGEAVGNVSHHLKVLAAAGFVEEAPELARDRRERWWRAVPQTISWSVADVAGDHLAEIVASAAEQQNLAHHVAKVQEWFGQRDAADAGWVRAAFSTENWVSVTPEELTELSDRIDALIGEYSAMSDRRSDPRRRLAYVFAHGVPARP